jgi:translation elongation factor EF-Ts
MEKILTHLNLPVESNDFVDRNDEFEEATSLISKFLGCKPENITEAIKQKQSKIISNDIMISEATKLISTIQNMSIIDFEPTKMIEMDYLELLVENVSLKLSAMKSQEYDETMETIQTTL